MSVIPNPWVYLPQTSPPTRLIRNPLGIPTPGMDLGPEIPPQKGPGTEIPPLRKDLGPEIPTPPCEQTNTYENITFPKLRLRAVKN